MDNNTRSGTFGGMLTVLLFRLDRGELISTVLLAAIGAVVSFGVSVFLKWAVKRVNRK